MRRSHEPTDAEKREHADGQFMQLFELLGPMGTARQWNVPSTRPLP